MMTEFIKIDFDWQTVKNFCRSTVKKRFTDGEPSYEFKRSLLIAEHSPIRELNVQWIWESIKYWVSTEWSRHKFEKYITSQRNDRQKEYDRNKAPQDSPVDFIGSANMQQLIDSFRKRLCYTATKEARELALDFKLELSKQFPIEASVLVPHCVYRGGCSEMLKCGHYQRFLEWWKDTVEYDDEFCPEDINMRYSAYHQYLKMETE
jgi:thymidylate synthase ThyX